VTLQLHGLGGDINAQRPVPHQQLDSGRVRGILGEQPNRLGIGGPGQQGFG